MYSYLPTETPLLTTYKFVELISAFRSYLTDSSVMLLHLDKSYFINLKLEDRCFILSFISFVFLV